MRLPSPFARLTHRASAAVATEVASAVRSTAEAAIGEVIEAVRAEISAPIPAKTAHHGRTAVTVAALTATAVVATAAYVWWKRRDRLEPKVADIEYANERPVSPRPAPVATATPVVAAVPAVELAHACAEPVAPAPGVTLVTPVSIEDCGSRSDGPRPSVTAANTSGVRPPLGSGRFAMPGVRRLVLPRAPRVLPQSFGSHLTT
jgi:hypothetical protein